MSLIIIKIKRKKDGEVRDWYFDSFTPAEVLRRIKHHGGEFISGTDDFICDLDELGEWLESDQ